MSKFQKRHYEAIATVLRENNFDTSHVEKFALMFAQDNPNFDYHRFVHATKVIMR